MQSPELEPACHETRPAMSSSGGRQWLQALGIGLAPSLLLILLMAGVCAVSAEERASLSISFTLSFLFAVPLAPLFHIHAFQELCNGHHFWMFEALAWLFFFFAIQAGLSWAVHRDRWRKRALVAVVIAAWAAYAVNLVILWDALHSIPWGIGSM